MFLDNTIKIILEVLLNSQKKNKMLYDQRAKGREFYEGDKVLLVLLTDTSKFSMQWKGPYKIISRCGKDNDYQVEVNREVKTFHANMMNKYMERADPDGTPQQNSDDNPVTHCDVCTGIIGENEDLSVNNDEMMELANYHQKEIVQNIKLRTELTKTQQEEFSNTLSRHKRFFRTFQLQNLKIAESRVFILEAFCLTLFKRIRQK